MDLPRHEAPPAAGKTHVRNPLRRIGAGLLILVLVATAVGFSLWLTRSGGAEAAGSGGHIETVALKSTKEAPPTSSLAQVVKRVLPSVVNIHVTTFTATPFGQSGNAKAEGSGVVLSRDGVILTNNHVVANATSVRVSFTDGHDSMTGTVIGTSPQHDLAIVKVDATDLKPITVGASSSLRLGDDVTALGFPLNLGGPTVTQGIVSGLRRDVTIASDSGTGSEHLKDLIQTDAAINPGNSGGPLVDGNGNLVGIDTAAASAASAENTGFAIAVQDAIPVVRQILAHPTKANKPWLGVSVTNPGALQSSAPAKGALVVGVVPDSPADHAGVTQGDLITAVGDHPVTSADGLTKALTGYSPGDRVTLSVTHRDGTRATIEITLGTRPTTLEG
jgi:putative serine protease PepD